jgi:hypothetical protein
MLLAEEETSVFMVVVSEGDLVCSFEYERLFHALVGVEGGLLVAGLAGDGFLHGAVLRVGVVVDDGWKGRCKACSQCLRGNVKQDGGLPIGSWMQLPSRCVVCGVEGSSPRSLFWLVPCPEVPRS